MRLRCSTSRYIGVGRLTGFRWIINGRGYANVVPSNEPQNVVYGLIYNLTPKDVEALDINEGVPYAYTKETMQVELWKSLDEISSVSRNYWANADVTKPGDMSDMLVYIDRQRIQEDKPKAEYVHRMNKGIADAVALGVPVTYVEEHMRPFIPPIVSNEMEELAKKQALSFQEEEDR